MDYIEKIISTLEDNDINHYSWTIIDKENKISYNNELIKDCIEESNNRFWVLITNFKEIIINYEMQRTINDFLFKEIKERYWPTFWVHITKYDIWEVSVPFIAVDFDIIPTNEENDIKSTDIVILWETQTWMGLIFIKNVKIWQQ